MVTVTEVLSQSALALRGVHVPRPGEPVRWVATSELADPSPFLEGGEVLLTTGMDTHEWDDEWAGYVARLMATGVAALGLGTGLTQAAVPAALERACREGGLNLFEVPRRTTFVAISRLTAGLLQAQDAARARREVAVQRELTEAAARHRDGTGVLRKLAAHLHGGAVLLGSDGSAVRGPVGEPPPPEADLASEVGRLRSRGRRASASLLTDGRTCLVQPVGLAVRPETYLAVWAPAPLGQAERAAVTTAVALLGLDAERARERRTAERRLRTRAMELFTSGDPRSAVVLLAAAVERPEPEPLPARVRLVEAQGAADVAEDALAALERDGGLEWVAVVADRLLAVVPAGRSHEVAARLAGAGMRVGVGAAVGPEEGARAAATARYAAAQALPGRPPVGWDDLVGDGVLAVLGDRAGAAFARSFLEPLAARPDLVTMLRSFLRHHGSRGQIAAELGIHRNTVRHRVAEIETTLGRSLDDPAARADAWIALQADVASAGSGSASNPADSVASKPIWTAAPSASARSSTSANCPGSARA